MIQYALVFALIFGLLSIVGNVLVIRMGWF